MARPPSLPLLLSRKIYKTGQTRGADDDVIYQNRVSRNSTVLIPYELYDELYTTEVATQTFERGCIFLIRPCDYFNNPNIDRELSSKNISLGVNALVFYQLRSDWENYNPKTTGWSVADSREAPLGGEFVARISATTAENNGGKISYGFNTKKMKGAGIRLFEYSSSNKISDCRTQLEAIYWLCHDSLTSAIEFGMTPSNAEIRRQFCLTEAHSSGLLDKQRLYEERMIDGCGYTVCPLWLG